MKYLRSTLPIVALALLGAGCLSQPAPVTTTPPEATEKPSEPALPPGTFKTKKGKLDSLRNVVLVGAQGNKISSPLIITGEARLWYFEAIFSIQLMNADGIMIDSSPAQADDDWMTEDWVPFTSELVFPEQRAGSKGKLIFIKDNPSGLPEHDDSVEIPVTF